MRILRMRRSRSVNVILGLTLAVLVLYAVYSYTSPDHVNNIKDLWKEGLRGKGVRKLKTKF